MKDKSVYIVAFVLLATITSFVRVYGEAGCPDSEKICLEYGGNVCKPVMSQEYQIALQKMIDYYKREQAQGIAHNHKNASLNALNSLRWR